MFKPSDPTFIAYKELQDSFGGNSVVILVYQDSELATRGGLERNDAIAESVNNIAGVSGVLSPAKLDRAIKRVQPLSMFSSAPALFSQGDPVAEGFDQLFAGYTHSSNHQRAAIVAILSDGHPQSTLIELRQLAADLPNQFGNREPGQPVIGETVLVGEPVLVHDGFALIERDGARLAIWTVALLSLVVIVSLADLRFACLMAVLIFWSVIVTRASMVWLGIELSIVSSILTAIVTVVAVAATLHLGVRTRIARARGKTLVESAVVALTMLAAPIFWTCATDAAGFAALNASRILPIRQFGMMIAFASIAVFLAVAFFAPCVMTADVPIGASSARWRVTLMRWQQSFARRLRRFCLRLASSAIHYRNGCLAIAMIAVVIAFIGVRRAETETSFLNNFRPDSSIVRAYKQVELHFGGAGVWDVVIDAPSELTGDFLDQVRRLQAELRGIEIDGEKLTKVLSLADAEQLAGQAALSSLASPASRLSFMSLTMPTFYKALITDGKDGNRKFRIMLRSREDIPSEQKDALITEVRQTVAEHLGSETWKQATGEVGQGKVSGYYVLMSQLVRQLVADQWRCFAASGVLVLMLLILATRSIKLATVALLPNLLPAFLVLAVVGLTGRKINMGAAMIAAVSIGLSIDGSVHFLAGYSRTKRRGHSPQRAAVRAAGSIGVPVFLATVALIVGFGVLATSEFIPTATFGILVAATMALGTIVNLTLLPAIVCWVDR
ncbi:MAG: RND family transporter [Rubripirellula sp.]